MKKKDKKGYQNIKEKFQFFGVMKTEGLYIYKSRKITLDMGIEEIKIIDIRKINEKKKIFGFCKRNWKFRRRRLYEN